MTAKHLLIITLLLPPLARAKTPALEITLAHGSRLEQKRKEQIERLAVQHDLEKYTVTRVIVIDEQAINHSMPVLTQNLRFLDNDDRALSAYLHEQAHWMLRERHRGKARQMLWELRRMFPNLQIEVPHGDGNEGTSYIHLVVLTLEWQALEHLIGFARSREVMDFKREDRYKALYATVIDNRARMDKFLRRFGVKW